MNNFLTKTVLVIALIVSCSFFKAKAQASVDPNDASTSLFCDGSAMTLTLPTTTGINWILRYSETQNPMPTATISMSSGGVISAADTKTGFYYLSSKSNDPNSCESEMQEIPVYVLKALSVAFTPANFCVESSGEQVGTVTSSDPKTQTFAYQWYKVVGSTETAISGENSVKYTPATPNAVGTTKYLLRAGYQINGKNYCPATDSHDVEVTAKPTKPTLTPTQIGGTAGAVIF